MMDKELGMFIWVIIAMMFVASAAVFRGHMMDKETRNFWSTIILSNALFLIFITLAACTPTQGYTPTYTAAERAWDKHRAGMPLSERESRALRYGGD